MSTAPIYDDPPDNPLTPEQTEAVIVAVVASDPSRVWRISEIVRAAKLDFSLIVSAAFLTLHREGGLERVGPALYRHPTASQRATAVHNAELFERELDA
jgi:hypothetical protein